MNQLGFFFDMTACTGCKTCQMACKDKNDYGRDVQLRQVSYFEGGKFPHPWLYYLSFSCGHCAFPECMIRCRAQALHKDEATGAVLVDRNKCVGCRECLSACPYRVPCYSETDGKLCKCDLCADLITGGGEPACSSSCPMRALVFGPIRELERQYGGERKLKGMPCESRTNAAFLVRPKPEARIHCNKETD